MVWTTCASKNLTGLLQFSPLLLTIYISHVTCPSSKVSKLQIYLISGPSLYVKKKCANFPIVYLYVVDLIYCHTNVMMIAEFKKKMMK